MEEYKKKYTSEDEENKEVINNEVETIERGRWEEELNMKNIILCKCLSTLSKMNV